MHSGMEGSILSGYSMAVSLVSQQENTLHRGAGNVSIGQEEHACRQDTRNRQQYFPCRSHSVLGC